MLKFIKLFFYLILGLMFSINYSGLIAENINFNGYSFTSKDSLGPVSKIKDKKHIAPKPDNIQSQNQLQTTDSFVSEDKLVKQEESINKDSSKILENIDSSAKISSSLNHDNLLDNKNGSLPQSKKFNTSKLDQNNKNPGSINIDKNKIDSLVDSSKTSKSSKSFKNHKTSNQEAIISIKAKAKNPSLSFDEHPMKIGASYLND